MPRRTRGRAQLCLVAGPAENNASELLSLRTCCRGIKHTHKLQFDTLAGSLSPVARVSRGVVSQRRIGRDCSPRSCRPNKWCGLGREVALASAASWRRDAAPRQRVLSSSDSSPVAWLVRVAARDDWRNADDLAESSPVAPSSIVSRSRAHLKQLNGNSGPLGSRRRPLDCVQICRISVGQFAKNVH